jgi:hypothetical protein
MKNLLYYLFMITVLVSCKEKLDTIYPSYVLAGHNQEAGILYKDLVPDDTIHINGYPDTLIAIRSLDIDNDLQPDFELVFKVSSPYMMGGSCSSMDIRPLGSNRICVSKTHNTWVEALNYSDTISDTNYWSDSTAILYSYCSFLGGETNTFGYWHNNSDSYCGISIIKDGHSFYGWLDIRCNIIRQYAITITM